MVDRKDVASWLDGPGAGTQQQDYPGQRLGRPQTGPGAVGRFGRRLAALVIDWVMCLLIAWGLFEVRLTETGPRAFVTNLVFLVENVLLLSTLGATFGQRLVGLRVVALGGGAPGAARVLLRSLLLSLGLPALFWDADQRGLHDQAARTVVEVT